MATKNRLTDSSDISLMEQDLKNQDTAVYAQKVSAQALLCVGLTMHCVSHFQSNHWVSPTLQYPNQRYFSRLIKIFLSKFTVMVNTSS